jgi:hypothetical protein
MARRGKPGIVTVGNRHEFPRSEWGSEDWLREDELQAKLGKSLGDSVVTPPPGPSSTVTTLFPKRRRRAGTSAMSDAVDALVEKYVGRR